MAYIRRRPRPRMEVDTEIKFEDAITINIPTLIRLLELAKEDIKNDPDLHFIAEKLVDISKDREVVTMSDYDDILEYLDANSK